jgi:hypothetical protein
VAPGSGAAAQAVIARVRGCEAGRRAIWCEEEDGRDRRRGFRRFCERGTLAKGCEPRPMDGERDCEDVFCRVCWNGVLSMFFIF